MLWWREEALNAASKEIRGTPISPANLRHHLYKIRELGHSVEQRIAVMREGSAPSPPPSPSRAPVSHFLDPRWGHLCLTAAYDRPEIRTRLTAYFAAGYDEVDLCIAHAAQDNPYGEPRWQIDIRKAVHLGRVRFALDVVRKLGKKARGWIFMDDEDPPLSVADRRAFIDLAKDEGLLSHPALSGLVLGLELNETLPDSEELREVGLYLRARTPKRLAIGGHWGSGRWSPHEPGKQGHGTDVADERRVNWWRANRDWCGALHFQVPHEDVSKAERVRPDVRGFLATPAAIDDWIPFLLDQLEPLGVAVFCAEYAFNVDPAEARRLGERAARNRIAGRQNG